MSLHMWFWDHLYPDLLCCDTPWSTILNLCGPIYTNAKFPHNNNNVSHRDQQHLPSQRLTQNVKANVKQVKYLMKDEGWGT